MTELVYCVTVAFTNLSLSKAILAFGKSRSRKEPNLDCKGLTEPGDVVLCQKSLNECWRMGRHIVVMNLIFSLGHFEFDGHAVYKLSQQRITAN